ncbi:hypothetical protein Tco_0596853 [Tanacetum coccineum]
MAESSSPDITPKEEPITLDRPKSPNPFLHAIQDVSDFISNCCLKEAFTRALNQYKEYLSEFWYTTKVLPDSKIWVSTLTGEVRGEIGITTFRNALKTQYLPHSSMYIPPPSITTIRPWFATIGYNGEIGAKGTLKKSCLPPRWRLLMGRIIQCLGGKTGGLDQISNKDATILYCLANGVQVDYAKIIWEYLIHKLNKKTREKIVPYPRFISLQLEHMAPKYDNEELTINPTHVFSIHNWILKPNQPEEPPFTDHMKAICNLDVPVDSKAPKYSSLTEEVPQGKKPGARSGLRRKQFSKHISKSTIEASKSQSGHSKKETKSSSAMDTSPSHLSPPTPVVGEMHKEAQQAAGGPTSLRDTSEDGAHPQLSSYTTKSARDGLKTAHTTSSENEESGADDILRKSEEEENAKNDKDTKDTSVPPPSLKSAQIQELMAQVYLLQSQKEELEQAKVRAEAEVASMKGKPSYPDINQLTKLLVTSLKPELSKLLASHDFTSCLPTELKELPSKIIELSREIKELKQHIKDMEI